MAKGLLTALPRLSFYSHVPKNLFLILLSLLCIPATAGITTVSLLISWFFKHRYERPAPVPGRKTILVTGVSMTKGLTIARLLAKNTPHRVIAADTEHCTFMSPARYSAAVDKFHRLRSPRDEDTSPYINSLLQVIRREKVDLWISCSSVVGAIEDGEVLRLAQQEMGPSFKAVQFSSEVVEKLHEKDAFMEYIQSLGLPIPESHRCTSVADVEDILSSSTNYTEKFETRKRFILKPIGVDDIARSQMMTLLPLREGREATSSYLSTLNITDLNPYILQQYINGYEYCTHSLVIRGEVRAFVACPSSDMLMYYQALHPDSAISRKMLKFTKRVAQDGGDDFTGHLSFDFLIEGAGEEARLYPIECNPRAHTAVVLFSDTPAMADAYLSVLGQTSGDKHILTPQLNVKGYFWAGHDVVANYAIPLVNLFTLRGSLSDVKKGLDVLCEHAYFWEDGAYAVWDPVPLFVLYHVYWPSRLLESLLTGRQWSRVNVSTGKMFGVH